MSRWKRCATRCSSAVCLSSSLAFIIGWVLSGAALRPIQRITDTAQVIGAQRDFDRRVDYRGPPDEVGQLATTFNGMLNELQGAYRQTEQTLQQQRRFVADASHELRTPLTTIRGNLGLLQRQPPIARGRSSGRAERHGRRNRSPDPADQRSAGAGPIGCRTLAAAVSLSRSRRSSTTSAVRPKLLGEQRTIVCEAVPEVSVMGDQDAIKQVLLILLDNALKFTPEGGTITIGAARGRSGGRHSHS